MDWSVLKWSDNEVSFRRKDTTYMAIEKNEDTYTVAFQQWEKVLHFSKKTSGSLLMVLDSFYDEPDRSRWGHKDVTLRRLQSDHTAWMAYVLSAPGIEVEGREEDFVNLRTLLNCIMDLDGTI